MNLSGGYALRDPWHYAGVTSDAFAALGDLPGVLEAVDGVRAAVDGLLREPALRRDRGRVRAAARVEAAWASSVLEGATISLEDFKASFDSWSGENPREFEDFQLCAASMRANADMRQLSQTWRSAPLQALAKLHSVVAADAPSHERGRPRADRVVAARLNALAEQVDTTAASGVVVYGLVQGELLDLRPFGWGDGLIARAASRLVLVARGVDPDALTAPERGLLNLGRDEYESKLAGYATGTPTGVADWLIFNAEAIRQGAIAARRLA